MAAATAWPSMAATTAWPNMAAALWNISTPDQAEHLRSQAVHIRDGARAAAAWRPVPNAARPLVDAAANASDVTMTSSLGNGTGAPPAGDLLRHDLTISAVLCVAYLIVFVVGLLGNSCVVAVVCRCPRMRSATNYFIANLAVADILVVVFCLPATLVSNIFVREYRAQPVIEFTIPIRPIPTHGRALNLSSVKNKKEQDSPLQLPPVLSLGDNNLPSSTVGDVPVMLNRTEKGSLYFLSKHYPVDHRCRSLKIIGEGWHRKSERWTPETL